VRVSPAVERAHLTRFITQFILSNKRCKEAGEKTQRFLWIRPRSHVPPGDVMNGEKASRHFPPRCSWFAPLTA